MATKLHFKITGAKGEADRELLRNNLKNLDSVKALRVTARNGYAEVALEIDVNITSKAEIIEVIKISGDFKVEEIKESENKISPAAAAAPDNDVSKASFMFGLLGGIGGAALIGSIILDSRI